MNSLSGRKNKKYKSPEVKSSLDQGRDNYWAIVCLAEKSVWESFTELRLEKMSRCYSVREVRGKIF